MALLADADQRTEGDHVQLQAAVPHLVQEGQRPLPQVALHAGADAEL